MVSQLSVDSQDSEYFDSLLTKSDSYSDSYGDDSDSFKQCNAIPSEERCYSVQRPSVDSYQLSRVNINDDNAATVCANSDSYTKLCGLPVIHAATWNSVDKLQRRIGRKATDRDSYNTLPGRLSNKIPARSNSYYMPGSYTNLPSMHTSYNNNPRTAQSSSSIFDTRSKPDEDLQQTMYTSEGYKINTTLLENTNIRDCIGSYGEQYYLGKKTKQSQSCIAGLPSCGSGDTDITDGAITGKYLESRKNGSKLNKLLKQMKYLVVNNNK